MRPRVVMAALAAIFSSPVSADSIDINLNNDAIEAGYTSTWHTADFTLGGLSNSDRDSWVASAGLLAVDQKQTQSTRTDVGVGGKVYVVSVGSQDVLALGLGGQVRVFPNNGPLSVGGYAFYAPNIVTSGDGEKFWEAGARVELEVARDTASIYIGYRKVRTDLENGPTVTVDSGGHAGLRINF